MFCKAGPNQGQAEQVSKIRKRIVATTYKPFIESLYKAACYMYGMVSLDEHMFSHSSWPSKGTQNSMNLLDGSYMFLVMV